MKKLLIILTLLLGTTWVHAQQAPAKTPQTADQKAEETITKLKSTIGLTDEQVPQVKAITVEKINQVTAAHKKNGADKNRLQAANKLIQDEWETKLKGIVTAEQFEKYLASKGK